MLFDMHLLVLTAAGFAVSLVGAQQPIYQQCGVRALSDLSFYVLIVVLCSGNWMVWLVIQLNSFRALHESYHSGLVKPPALPEVHAP